MPDRHVRIERIAARLRGASARTGREVADGLAQSIVRSIAESGAIGPAARRELRSLDLGRLTAPRETTGARIADAIGRAVAASLDGRKR
jgi:hypothetical protein